MGSLGDILDSVLADSVRERSTGFSDLKHALEDQQKQGKLDDMKDKHVHHLFETLFQVTSKERSTYAKAAKNTVKSVSATRLAACASAVRSATTILLFRMRLKTLKAFLGHVIQALSYAEEELCQPLRDDYTKALRSVLEYRPHVEHISQEDWSNVLDFCLQGVAILNDQDSQTSSSFADSASTSRTSLLTSQRASMRTTFTETPAKKSSRGREALNALIHCVRALVSATNCNMGSKADAIALCIISFLSSSVPTTSAHSAAFATLNLVLERIRLTHLDTSRQILCRLLPLMRQNWTSRDSGVKDQILIALLLTQPHLDSIYRSGGTEAHSLRSEIEALYEDIRVDYLQTEQRDRRKLNLDDISLQPAIHPAMRKRFATESFHLRPGNASAEYGWAVLSVLGHLASWLDLYTSGDGSRPDTDDQDGASKRRKGFENKLEELVRTSRHFTGAQQVSILQVTCFTVVRRRCSLLEADMIMESIPTLISNSDKTVACWALLTLSECLAQRAFCSQGFVASWRHVWQSAWRLIASAPHCRAACHFLGALLDHGRVSPDDIAIAVQSLNNAASLHGPAQVSDASLSFWITIMEKDTVVSTNAKATREVLLTWLFSKWQPSNLENRNHVLQMSTQISSTDVLLFLGNVLGARLAPLFPWHDPTASQIQQTCLTIGQGQEFSNFLFPQDDGIVTLIGTHLPTKPSAQAAAGDEEAVIDYLQAEAQSLIEAWTGPTPNNQPLAMTANIARALTTFIVIASAASGHLAMKYRNLVHSLEKKLEALTATVASYVGRNDSSTGALDYVLSAIRPALSSLQNGTVIDDFCMSSRALTHIASPLVKSLSDLKTYQQHANSASQPDDLDEFEDSQPMRTRIDPVGWVPSTETIFQSSTGAMSQSTLAYLHLISLTNSKIVRNQGSFEVPGQFFRYLLDLDVADMLCCKPLIERIVSSGLIISEEDATSLLEHMMDTYLQDYDYERSEVPIELCLQLLKGFVSVWATASDSKISEYSADLYDWFAGRYAACSPRVQSSFSELLFDMIKTPFQSDGKQSTRSVLLAVLAGSDLQVQYHMSDRIARIFDLYTLSQHEAVFSDVLNSLPTDSAKIEAIAVRLHALSNLASAWRTLLRRCIFHLFEVAAQVPNAARYAKMCFEKIAEAYSLDSPRELFKIFGAQLMFTWLEESDLSTVPFAEFGFPNMAACLSGIDSEIVGQLAIGHGKDNTACKVFLEQTLGISFKQLIATSFARVMAYGLLKDASTKSKEGNTSHDVEDSVRKAIGASEFTAKMSVSYADIIGHALCHIENEDQIERSLSKIADLQSAADIIRKIKDIGFSEQSLAAAQQPSFRSRYLSQLLFKITRITRLKLSDYWKPQPLTKIVRHLLSDMNPVLGSPHARKVICRLRILVAFAGDSIYHPYIIEQVIHGLRPLITDHQCAADAVGLVQYLLDHGRGPLGTNFPFILGTSIALYLSMAKFLKSPQSSTTQDSEHIATVSTVAAFRSWLDQFVDSLSSVSRDSKRIVRAAKGIDDRISPASDTPGRELITLLLVEVQVGRLALSHKLLGLCFTLTCAGFIQADSHVIDAFGSGEASCPYMPSLWRSILWPGLSDQYYLWAAKALGRAYGHLGSLHAEIGKETDMDHPETLLTSQVPEDASTLSYDSKAAILEYLLRTLHSESASEVGIAESTIQEIFRVIPGSSDDMLLQNYLSDAHRSALLSKLESSVSSMGFEMRETSLDDLFGAESHLSHSNWLREVCLCAIRQSQDPFLKALGPALAYISDLPERALPFIIHLTLLNSVERTEDFPARLATAIKQLFVNHHTSSVSRQRSMLNVMVYLWTRVHPRETSRLDRSAWIDIDQDSLLMAASDCKMFKTALYLYETSMQVSPVATHQKRRSAAAASPDDLLYIYRQLDEPDSYYGVEQPANIDCIAERMEFEGNSSGSLMLRGAQLDSLARADWTSAKQFSNVLGSLTRMNLNSLARQLGYVSTATRKNHARSSDLAKSALKLQQWDLNLLSSESAGASLTAFRSLQSLSQSTTVDGMRDAVNNGVRELVKIVKGSRTSSTEPIRSPIAALTAMTNIHDLLDSDQNCSLRSIQTKLQQQEGWMATSSSDEVDMILTTREAFLGIVTHDNKLQGALRLQPQTAMDQEIEAKLHSSSIYRSLGDLQASLANVVHLSESTRNMADKIELSSQRRIKMETAKVLWAKAEPGVSIRMLQELSALPVTAREMGELGSANVLAMLAQWSSEARLERPEEIMTKYLRPAMQQLSGQTAGTDAGRVFHEFASYCHKQLTHPDFTAEFKRSRKYLTRKSQEIKALEAIVKGNASSNEKNAAKGDRARAKKWLTIDGDEYQRLKDTRDQLLRSSLENFLSSLAAWDDEDHDVLRFFALWLEHADEAAANDLVATAVTAVPTHKFIQLLNQLSSKLQASDDMFQKILNELVEKICRDHPYHGMNFIYAGSKTPGGNDRTAQSRNSAAMRIANRLASNASSRDTWSALARANDLFIEVAAFKNDDTKQGRRLKMRSFAPTRKLEKELPRYRLPPITMQIEVRASKDYSDIPHVAVVREDMTIAGGLSTPKIISLKASDGRSYKQLYKAGSDDLRQDAIMEQVFEQVSSLLKSNKATKQRNLTIRTYRVVPLNSNAGVIEFVNNTTSFNDYLQAAHPAYHPKDLQWGAARKRIEAASRDTKEKRIAAYRDVCERFHPTFRHFFFENFEDPDTWFKTRLAYTRSTAAISILGWILGLGDRHCQNILLDKATGEVVHIDLGVSFEAGRVLNIPEVVPFRLTRDVVDGFGITRTEGVFRRCCEFTLDALRAHTDAIMTLLNVLRYDPLYSWSVSPLRARKLQHEAERGSAASAGSTARATRASGVTRTSGEEEGERRDDEEGGEADRALGVVEKKLRGGLSAEATVNELIQAATDEKNLAVMFCGWAAYV